MAVEVVFAPETEEDVDLAYSWYESEQPGRGEAFLLRLRDEIASIGVHPEMHGRAAKNYRRALLRPYLYEFADGFVTVYGVFHTSRDAQTWRSRIQP